MEGRLAAGLTQEQLADRVQTEQTRVSEWERGATTPRPAAIPALAAAVGLAALDLLTDNPSAAALEDLRLAAGMTMQEAADEVGISLRRYRGIETGSTRRPPSSELIEKFAKVFDAAVDTVVHALAARG